MFLIFKSLGSFLKTIKFCQHVVSAQDVFDYSLHVGVVGQDRMPGGLRRSFDDERLMGLFPESTFQGHNQIAFAKVFANQRDKALWHQCRVKVGRTSPAMQVIFTLGST